MWLHERLPADPAAWNVFCEPHLPTISELVVVPTGRTAAAVRAWWTGSQREVGRDIIIPEHGQYAGFGVDRLCAGLAATAQERCDVIVVDGGTATTITAWTVAGPTVLGGLIVPSAGAWIAGLAAAAPALPVVEPQWQPVSAIARTPAAAIAAAVGIGFPAALQACVERVQAETGIRAVVTTGGGMVAILGGFLPRRSYRPSLVCEGAEILSR